MPHSISVIITTYNQSAFIGEALESVLTQSHQPSEIIVVNDGSTDDTDAQLTPYRARIRYIYQTNRGVAASRNTGVRNAGGELLAFLDSDDVWHPEKLARQVAAFNLHPDCGLIAVNGVQFDECGIRMEDLLAPCITGNF